MNKIDVIGACTMCVLFGTAIGSFIPQTAIVICEEKEGLVLRSSVTDRYNTTTCYYSPAYARTVSPARGRTKRYVGRVASLPPHPDNIPTDNPQPH